MTKAEILDFLRANPMCFLATVDGDHPRVRGMMLFISADERIIFHTGKVKQLTQQLSQNCAVEFCAIDPKTNMQIRVSGAAAFLVDPALSEAIIAERPFLKPIIEQFGIDAMPLFQITDPVATVWTMGSDMEPKTYVAL